MILLFLFLALYVIGYVLYAFAAVFLTIFIPFVVSLATLIVVAVTEGARALSRRRKPRPVASSQARFSNRR